MFGFQGGYQACRKKQGEVQWLWQPQTAGDLFCSTKLSLMHWPITLNPKSEIIVGATEPSKKDEGSTWYLILRLVPAKTTILSQVYISQGLAARRRAIIFILCKHLWSIYLIYLQNIYHTTIPHLQFAIWNFPCYLSHPDWIPHVLNRMWQKEKIACQSLAR